MNILALDCAVTRISLAVKTETKFISTTYDIGMRQSEILVPAIDEILKKAELAYNVPVYGISSLEAYAFPYKNFGVPVLSCIDANKDKFYARITEGEKLLLKDDDYEIEKIAEAVKDLETICICGPDAKKLSEKLQAIYNSKNFLIPEVSSQTAEALIKITEELIEKKAEPLKDFDGPVYLRASEAELKLNSATS